MLTIGPHLSISKGFTAAARECASLDGTTFQFFTRNPRGGKAKALDEADLQTFPKAREDAQIGCIMAHAPYTLNPASDKERTVEFALEVMADDLLRMEQIMPGQLYNMHPGSHVGQGVDIGIQKIAHVLNEVLQPQQTTMVLLETMAGKGSEVGATFAELARIIEQVELNDHMGVCLDTCHVWDAGYDIVGNLDGVLEEFDRVIGLSRLRALHLNDSKNPCGAHKDRHERIGQGALGLDAFAAVVTHPMLRDLPMYLETPQDEVSGYAVEIATLRELASAT